MNTLKFVIATAIVCCGLAGSVFGQEPDPSRNRSDGFHLDGVGLSFTRATQTIPNGVTNFRDATFLGASQTATAEATATWRRTGRRSFMQWESTSLYGHRSGASSGDVNEATSLQFGLTPRRSKWRVSAGANAILASFDEALFFPNTYANAVSSPANFNQLTGAVLRGDGTDPMLTTAKGFEPDTTAARALYGRTTAYGGGHAAIVYGSPRVSTTISLGGFQLRHLADPSDVQGLAYPRVTTSYVGPSLQFVVTPQTTVGVDATVSRTFSPILQNTGVLTNAFITKAMRRRWFFRGSIGAGSNSSAAN